MVETATDTGRAPEKPEKPELVQPVKISPQDVRDRYLLPVKDEDLAALVEQLGAEGVEQWAREQASSLYPQFSAQISAGAWPKLLVSPYASLAAEELEREVSPTDRIVTDYFSLTQAPSMAEFRQHVRSLPEWDETEGAERQANQLMDFLSVGGPTSEEE